MKNLQKSILATLAYFDLFDYPLTADEIWRWLINIHIANNTVVGSGKELEIRNGVGQQLELGREMAYNFDSGKEIKQELDELVKQSKVDKKNEFYFLPNRSEIVEIRKQRYQISLKKIKKAKRIIWLLRFIPWIKAIFICSSLGFFNAQEKSDIDLLIITSKNGIWSARFWSVGILKILGLRPGSNNVNKDKFCLSYFISEDNLNLEDTRINNFDIHLIYLLSYHLPLYFEDNLWQRFGESNKWIKRYLPNLHGFKHGLYADFLIKPCLLWLKRLIRKSQFKWEEKLVKKFQLWYMPKALKEMANQGSRVIINDKMIKLHSNDKRQMVFEKWQEKLKRFITYDLSF